MIKLPIFKDGIIHRGSDGFGSGLNGVPRGEGVHLGEDFVKELGATVYAPVSGVIKHRNPYEIKSGDKDPTKIDAGGIDFKAAARGINERFKPLQNSFEGLKNLKPQTPPVPQPQPKINN